MADGKWITGLTPGTPVEDAARRVLAVRLGVVRDALTLAVREPERDPEYVHKLRVGTRRAAAALDVFAPCLPGKVRRKARKRLRRLRRAAGMARDWDVFLAALPAPRSSRHRAGLDFLAGYALGRRTAAQALLEQAGPDHPFDFERWLAETVAAVHPPGAGPLTLLDLARPLLSARLQELDQAAAGDLTDYANLHQVRIAGKRLRYAMEVFGACFAPPFRERLYPAVAEMQEVLGRANDSHVAAQRLAALRERLQATLPDSWKRLQPGIDALLRSHQERLPEERRRFLGWWTRWQQSGGEAAFLALLEKPPPRRKAGG